jgi:hypothetical protein
MERRADHQRVDDQTHRGSGTRTAPGRWPPVWFSGFGEIVRVDRSPLAVPSAVSGGVGYAIPLIVGIATGRIAYGIAASAGALIVAFADVGGRYPLKVATLLAATFAVGAAALLGGLVASSVVATTVLIGVWGFAGGRDAGCLRGFALDVGAVARR